MKKIKKILSFVTAISIAASMLAGFSISANAENDVEAMAVGDVLMSQDFDAAADAETEPWGKSSRVDKFTYSYPNVESLTDEVKSTMPETVSGNVLGFENTMGQNVSVLFTMAPEMSAAADVYNVSFDTYIKNAAAEQKPATENIPLYTYNFGFGDTFEGVEYDMFEFHIAGSDIYYVSNGENIDTGLDTGDNGVWVTVNIKCDVPNHKFGGTITTVAGDKCEIKSADFADNGAVDIKEWHADSNRYSGSIKGHMRNYLDNFVVTEGSADIYSDVTIKYVDESGNAIKDEYADTALVGSLYEIAASHLENIASDDESKYYEYKSGADAFTVADGGNTIYLVFALKDKLLYEVTAIDTEGNVLKTIETGLVAPGESVTAYGDYAMYIDGQGYKAVDKTSVKFTPVEENNVASIEYELVKGIGAKYDFEDGATIFSVNNEGMTLAAVDSTDEVVNPDVNGEKALKLTSAGSGSTKIRTASLPLSRYADGYSNVTVNYDAYITNDGRMTLSLFDSAITGYSDAGMLSIGTKDSGGFRINGVQHTGSRWIHGSVNLDFANGKIAYVFKDSVTNKVITSGSSSTDKTVLDTLSFISWADTSAYIDNIEVVSAGKETAALEYDFEDEVNPFTGNDHTVTAVVSSADDETVANGSAIKFSSDASTGESKQAVAMIDISNVTKGATEVTVDYDSYVNSSNVYFGIASDSVSEIEDKDILFSSGYRSSKGYYVIYGESGSAYTSANGVWVHTKLVYNCETGVINYTLSSADGNTVYKSGSKTYKATEVSKIFIASGAESSTGYMDNVTVNVKKPEAVDFEDTATYPFKDNAHAVTAIVSDVAEINADINGTSVLKFTSDSGTGESATADSVYDISALTAGKGKVIVSYDSYIPTGASLNIGVAGEKNIFTHGFRGDYYRINGESGSAFIAAVDTWVHTVLDFDLNAGVLKYTLTTADGAVNYSKSMSITETAVKNINVSSWFQSECLIDNICVTALGTYESKSGISYSETEEKGTITVTLADTSITNANLIYAVHDSDGYIIEVKIYDIVLTDGVATMEVELLDLGGGSLYVWDSVESMTPLTECVKVADCM